MFVLHNNPWGLHFRALVLLVVCATLATCEHGLHGFFHTHCTSLTPSRLSDWNKRTPGLPQIMLMHLALLYDHFFHSPPSSRPSLIHRRGVKLSKESYLARLRVGCSNSLIQEACSRNWRCILTTHHYGNIRSVITLDTGLQMSPHIFLHHLYIVSAEVSLSCLQDVLYVFWHYFILGNSKLDIQYLAYELLTALRFW